MATQRNRITGMSFQSAFIGKSRRCSRAKEESERKRGEGVGGGEEVRQRRENLVWNWRREPMAMLQREIEFFMSKRVWRRECEGRGWEGKWYLPANEAVNNDGFLLFPSRSCIPFSIACFIAWVGSLKKERKERSFIPGNYDALCEVPLRVSVVTVLLTNTRFLSREASEKEQSIFTREIIST